MNEAAEKSFQRSPPQETVGESSAGIAGRADAGADAGADTGPVATSGGNAPRDCVSVRFAPSRTAL